MNIKIEFKERQKFTQCQYCLFLIGLRARAVYKVIQQILFGIEFGRKPMLNTRIVILVFDVFGFIFFIWYITLIMEIDTDRIKMRFVPFVKKKLN